MRVRRPTRRVLRLAAAVPRLFADPLAWRLARRNVWRSRRRTAVVLAAVSVGIGGAVLTMAVNYGMVVEMIEAAIQTRLGHLQVHAQGFEDDPTLERRLEQGVALGRTAVQGARGVAAWAPRVRGEGLLYSPRASVGVSVVGVDPAREAAVTVLEEQVVEGRYLDGERRRVLIGEALAQRLSVGVGDKVVLSVQDLAGDLTGEAYRVGGIFRTASRELDRGSVFLPLEESQELLGLDGAVSELVVRAEPRADLEALRGRLRERLGSGVEVRTWRELEPLLVYLIETFDTTGWIVYAAVFVAMAFGIANVLLMAVYERVREIGIQRAVGMPPVRVVATIVDESLLLTAVGLALGLGAAWLGVTALGDGIDLSRFSEGLTAYGIPTRIRPVVRSDDVVVPSLVAVVTAVVASAWPAVHAARIRPVEALRHV